MQGRDGGATELLASFAPALWILAIVFFGVGDLLTTATGFISGEVVEVGPVVGPIIERFGVGALIGLKAAVFGICFLMWQHTPHPHRVGVPLGLAALGVLVTGWNIGVLLVGSGIAA